MEDSKWILCPVCGNKNEIAATGRYGTEKFPALVPWEAVSDCVTNSVLVALSSAIPSYQVMMLSLLCSSPSAPSQCVVITNLLGEPLTKSTVSSKLSPGSSLSKGSLSCMNA